MYSLPKIKTLRHFRPRTLWVSSSAPKALRINSSKLRILQKTNLRQGCSESTLQEEAHHLRHLQKAKPRKRSDSPERRIWLLQSLQGFPLCLPSAWLQVCVCRSDICECSFEPWSWIEGTGNWDWVLGWRWVREIWRYCYWRFSTDEAVWRRGEIEDEWGVEDSVI